MCHIAGCERVVNGQGLCGAHYFQQWKYGDALRADKRRQAKPKNCVVEGCDYRLTKPLVRGMCQAHYQKWSKYGDPLKVVQHQPRGSVLERLAQSFKYSPYCWVWTRHTTKGYGRISVGGTQREAHRVAYELFVGEIPENYEVDHKCNNRPCVNPQHLRLATRGENAQNMRGARSDSTTGYRGVQYMPKRGTYIALASFKGQRYTNGTNHKTAEDANLAAIELRNRLYTHNGWDRM